MANNLSDNQSTRPNPVSPEVIAFATKMYNAARSGDLAVFQQALPAGLPPNMTNDKGDTLVSPVIFALLHPLHSPSSPQFK